MAEMRRSLDYLVVVGSRLDLLAWTDLLHGLRALKNQLWAKVFEQVQGG